MLFGLYLSVGSAIGALVDGYGFAAAFAMAASQVLEALVLLPVYARRMLHAAPGHL
jgi:multidrug efflux pump subunit AcrB